MADTLLQVLERLKGKITGLAARNSELEARNVELEKLCESYRLKAEEAEQERKRAELDSEFLAVSHRLADNPDSIVETRRHIARLIRNIDRCLEMLKE